MQDFGRKPRRKCPFPPVGHAVLSLIEIHSLVSEMEHEYRQRDEDDLPSYTTSAYGNLLGY
jgi:hypothetical protein